MQLGLLRRGDWLGIALMAVGLAALQTVLDDGNVYDWFGSPFIVQAEPSSRRWRWPLSSCVELVRAGTAGQFPAAGAAQFRLRHAGQLPARLRALRLGLSAAAVPRRVAGFQRRADRRGDGLDRPAAAADHPVRAAADEADRRAAAGRRRLRRLRRQLLHEPADRPRLCRAAAVLAQRHRARSARRW